MILAWWIEVYHEHDDPDEDKPRYSFKAVGQLGDLTASVARVALELEHDQMLDVKVERMTGDE